MEPEANLEMPAETMFCPECGAEEAGYFCRNCGALLRGEDLVLCPRCHQIVPDGDYCNQCGQSLSGIALHLRQLALAGDDFYVTSAGLPALARPAEVEPDFFSEDESQPLEVAEVPDWLQELPVESAPPQVRERIYPALQPVEKQRTGAWQGRFLTFLVVLMGLLLLGLVVMAVLALFEVG